MAASSSTMCCWPSTSWWSTPCGTRCAPGGSFSVEVRRRSDSKEGDLVAIGVFDQGGPHDPVAVEADELAESGRGLRTVSLTAESWGWFGNSGGRTVVAVFAEADLARCAAA
jgi:hypothetical protein